VIAIDQFRPDYLQRFGKFFGPGGFRLLLEKGANFTEAHYQHAVTQTCPGHAVMLTGSYADVNGIVANNWYDTESHKPRYCAADTLAKLIGVSREGRSPRALLDSTVGDELKVASDGRSRVIAIAGKDRSAIMLGGHRADAAYWTEDTLIVSSTYYMPELPEWVRRFNTEGRVSQYRGATWNHLLPASAYSIAGQDNVAAEENPGGMGKTFPHRLATTPLAEFLEGFQTSPFEDEVLIDFAMEAVKQEKLGQDDDPDLLGLGFSANDLVGHSFGPDSHEMMDITVRTDRMLERLFTFLGQQIGLDRVVIVLTSDHGVAPLPELAGGAGQRGSRGGRIDPAVMAAAAEDALRGRYGAPRRPTFLDQPTWIIYQSPPWLYLNLEGLEDKRISLVDAERVAQQAVQRVPGVARVITGTELRLERANRSHSRTELSFYPGRSGNIYYVLDPYLIPEKQTEGTTHGSPWEYDTHVPLLWWGTGTAIKPGSYAGSVSEADLAPTLSQLLGIRPPTGSQGRVLSEMFSGTPPQ
jgi:predicted AlkP superfamily pyrophosphatase or phosphodiesterase